MLLVCCTVKKLLMQIDQANYSCRQLSTNNFDSIRSGMYEKLKVISRGVSYTCTDCLQDVYHMRSHTLLGIQCRQNPCQRESHHFPPMHNNDHNNVQHLRSPSPRL